MHFVTLARSCFGVYANPGGFPKKPMAAFVDGSKLALSQRVEWMESEWMDQGMPRMEHGHPRGCFHF